MALDQEGEEGHQQHDDADLDHRADPVLLSFMQLLIPTQLGSVKLAPHLPVLPYIHTAALFLAAMVEGLEGGIGIVAGDKVGAIHDLLVEVVVNELLHGLHLAPLLVNG